MSSKLQHFYTSHSDNSIIEIHNRKQQTTEHQVFINSDNFTAIDLNFPLASDITMAELTTSTSTLHKASNLTATAYITVISTLLPTPTSTPTPSPTAQATATYPRFIYNPYTDHDNIGKPHTSSADHPALDLILLSLTILWVFAYSFYWSVLTNTLEVLVAAFVQVVPLFCKGWNRGMRMIEEGGWWRYRMEILALGLGVALGCVWKLQYEVMEVVMRRVVERVRQG